MAAPSMPSQIDLVIKGLYTNPSTFGGNAPPGALTIANNVVLDQPSVVATRRGFNNSFSTLPNAGALSLFSYNNTKLLHGTDNKMYVDLASNGSFTAFPGVYLPPQGVGNQAPASRVRGVEANKDFFFITDAGTYRLDAPTGQPRLAGAPQGLNGTAVVTGTTGFLAVTSQVAYRVVFGYQDANGNLVLGAPSSRIICANPSTTTTANAIVTFQLPKEITAAPINWIYQLYRSDSSPNLTTPPDDECALISQGVCTATTTMTVTDITPNSLVGTLLYTNQSQLGITASQFRPPWATDICLFKQYTFYANTRDPHIADITLVGSGVAPGLVVGDTITFTDNGGGFAPFTLTAATANNLTTGAFLVSNTGNPGLDIGVTAANIAYVANGYTTNTFLAAYYLSSNTDLPGKLEFDRLDFNTHSFTISTSRATAWSQTLPLTSKNSVLPNRLWYSTFSQPDAVPIVNYFDVGSANQPINRIMPLRDGIIILKQDGIFRLSGNAPSAFAITPVDNTATIVSDNSAVVLDNLVYFLSDQGVCAVTDSDVQIMSFVLDKTLQQNISASLYPNLQATCWAIAYQSDRKYILSLPQLATDTQATHQYVYNVITEAWVTWTLTATCGLVFNADGELYLGTLPGSAPNVTDSYVYKERKSITSADYVDNQYATTPVAGSTTNIITINTPAMPSGVTILVGWALTQPNTGNSANIIAVSVVGSTTVLQLDLTLTWDTTQVIVYTPITSTVQTIQLDGGSPTINKQFSEITYVFTEQGFNALTATLTSDANNTGYIDTLLPRQLNGWGATLWGSTPWGGTSNLQGKIRRYVPQYLMRASWLYINLQNSTAFTSFGWSGATISYKPVNTRQR